MKVLHVNMSLDAVTGGGTVERVKQLHKVLLNLGVDSHILTIDSPENKDENISINEVTVLPCLSKRWFIPYPALSTVKKVVAEADVIHLMNHWTLINCWVFYLARKLGKPYIICPAGALSVFGRSKLKKYLYQRLIGRSMVRNASAAIVISLDEITNMKECGLDSQLIHHIPNGVNEGDFSYSDAAFFREASGIGLVPYILFVGRINAIKGPDLLLSAFAKLHDVLPHHLVFAGPDGGMVEQLKHQLKELNLTSRVHFTGYLGGDLKSSAYHGAALLAVPSRHEAMSIVALEAAISETPVLLTDQCGFSSLDKAGAALEVPASISGLSKGLKKMLVDDCNLEKMGKCGRTFALENYTWFIMAKRFIELVNSIKK